MTITPRELNEAQLHRSAELREVDETARTVSVAFSSETPVTRWFGEEVLSHDPSAVRLDRMRDGAAVLVGHDGRDQVGAVQSVALGSDGRARAVLRFGRSARADEIFADIQDGIRRHVSVGYIVHALDVEQRDGAPDLVRVTDWEPFEISIVSIPADPSVGVGRSHERGKAMTTTATTETGTDTQPRDPAAAERERVQQLLDLGGQYDARDLAERMIRDGRSADALAAELIKRQSTSVATLGSEKIGMGERDLSQYSLMRVVRYLANPDAASHEAAGLELEASAAVAQRSGRDPQGVHVPLDVLGDPNFARRDLNTGTTAAGGALVGTELLAGSFIDLLRARTVIFEAGAQQMQGLRGNVALPRLAGGATLAWVPEAGAPADSDPTFDTVPLTPHTASAAVPITRRMLLQSTPDAEQVMRRDLAARFARGIESAALGYQTDANAPGGLRPEIATGAPTWNTASAPTFAELIGLHTTVAEADGDVGNMAYITGPRVAGRLRATPVETGNPAMIWQPEPDGRGTIGGVSAFSTSTVAVGDVFCGNWSDLVVGFWSGIDLRADTATLAASDGVVVRGFMDMDAGIRHTASFALGTNA